jgi:ribosomal protein S18 acetylase RimI-like enzyme
MIRLARAADVTTVTALVNEAYSIYVVRNGKIPGPMRDDYARLISEQRVHVLEDSGEVVGLVVLFPAQDAMLLDNVAVTPRAQGRGFGLQLMRFAEAQARARGFAAIRLYTQDVMVENLALYTRLGFVETHRAEQLGLNRIHMAKAL